MDKLLAFCLLPVCLSVAFKYLPRMRPSCLLGSTCIRNSRRTWRTVKKTEFAHFRGTIDGIHFIPHRNTHLDTTPISKTTMPTYPSDANVHTMANMALYDHYRLQRQFHASKILQHYSTIDFMDTLTNKPLMLCSVAVTNPLQLLVKRFLSKVN